MTIILSPDVSVQHNRVRFVIGLHADEDDDDVLHIIAIIIITPSYYAIAYANAHIRIGG